MILVEPGNKLHIFKVFVRNEYTDYDVSIVNSQTNIVTKINGTQSVSEAIAELEIQFDFEEKNWYNLYVSKDDVLQNYSMIYCDIGIAQRYSNFKNKYITPVGNTPEYVMPV